MHFGFSSWLEVTRVRRGWESIMKTLFCSSHVTCSKLKLNCTNPSELLSSLTIPFCVFSLSFLAQTDYYSVSFPPFLDEFSSRCSHSSFSSSRFIIILLFHFSFWSSHFRLTEKAWNCFTLLRFWLFFFWFLSRHWCVLSLSFSVFIWIL